MSAGSHVVAINFRDPGHPEAGGAEVHLEAILAEAVRRGMRVTWLASGFPGAPPESEHDGMRILRRGSFWNFNWIVPRVLRGELARPVPDLVIEDVNKVPCFAPWHTRAPVGLVVPHLFGATAFREAPLPVALYVLALEALIPRAYAGARVLAISGSTRDDLVARGIAPGRVAVVHCGLDHALYRRDPAVAKSARPTIVVIGRVRRYKGLGWVLASLPRLLGQVPDARLVVVGDGPHLGELKLEAARRGLAPSVEFRGFLSPRDKVRVLQEAWVLVQPSPKEGWGLTVVEAGACGTAVVAADSPGLRDSVRRDVTGLLVPYGDAAGMAGALARVLLDRGLRESLAAGGVEWAGRFAWPDCARRSLDVLLGGAGAR
ncbi:MAG TPA: glycosyltransferase family 4 protein [Candidatus Eisenbacteria bacterium]